MNRSQVTRILSYSVIILLIGIGVTLWLARDRLRSPEKLYIEAQHASSERAAKLYEVLASRLPEIEEYARMWQAQATMPDPEAFRSLQILAEYLPNRPLAYLAHLEIARYYINIDSAKAEESYLAALSLHHTPAVQLELARYFEERQDNQSAYDQYRQLLALQPDAFVGMRRNASDPLQLAEDLNNATYFSDAIDVLQGIDDPRASRLRGWAYLGLGDYLAAIEQLQPLIETESLSEEDSTKLAQALARVGVTDEAIAIYSSIESPDSLIAQAGLLEETNPEEAVDLYLSVPYPVAWWNATWILEEQGKNRAALPVYARIAESSAYFGDDAAYRLFVLGKRSGNASAVSQGKGFLKDYGINWLSLRAGVMDSELQFEPTIEPGTSNILTIVETLDNLGRDDLADLELLFCAQYRRQPGTRLACLQGLASRGLILEAESIASEVIENGEQQSIEMWRLAYPMPYQEIVVAYAEEVGIEPLLIWSVMRAESRYDPRATSYAGARGLMQIIPTTQDWISQQLDLNLSPGDIYVPEINIWLGAWYLRYLLDQFDGDIELAIPAYNGGPENVQSWLDDAMVQSRDDFIRWIGFGETREYLERVSINYWIYQQIYSP